HATSVTSMVTSIHNSHASEELHILQRRIKYEYPIRLLFIYYSAVTLIIGLFAVRLPAQVPDLEAQSASTGIVLCQHINYDGRCQTFTSDALNLVGSYIGNDEASSIRVAPGWAVSVSENIYYDG